MAAAVAGSVIAVGVGTPAFAADGTAATPVMPTSINGGVDELIAAQPVQQVVTGTHLDGTLQSADRTTDGLSSATPADGLVSQAEGTVGTGVLPTLNGVVPNPSLLGGLPLGGLPAGG